MDRYLPSDPLDEPRGAPTILLIPELHPAIPMVPTPAIIKQGDGEELKLVEEMGIGALQLHNATGSTLDDLSNITAP
jgi:hypothetical protein